MLPKPSLVLQVRLRPKDYSEAQAAEIKRSYMYLAQSIVSELGEDERAEGNLMRLNVRLMKPFWDPSDPAAETLWRISFMPWLANATRNMSTAMHNYNTVLHPLGAGNVTYEWADFDFAPHAILRLKVDDENRIPSEAPALCDKVRTLSAEGAFGEDVACIRIPSRASIAAQKAAFEEEQARYRAARAAKNEAVEEAADDVAAVEAAEAVETAGTSEGGEQLEGIEAAALIENAEAVEAAESAEASEAPWVTEDAENVEVVATDDSDADVAADAAAEPLAKPTFSLDYSIWGIEYADGTVVEFDSRTH